MKKLSIYFTAGIPQLDSTTEVLKIIQNSGADLVEIGIPYSDPVADGPVIQNAHKLALENGMNMSILFDQLREIKDQINIPTILMGYLNPIISFGFEKFCQKCSECGISGLIVPDLPAIEFEKNYQKILKQYGLNFSFLVTPETSDERIMYLDGLSSGFLYAVSSSSTTGNLSKSIDNEEYINRLVRLQLKNPVMIGFSIKNKTDFEKVTEKLAGGIIGTSFVNMLLEEKNWQEMTANFISNFKK